MKKDLTIFYTDDDHDDLEFFVEIVNEISESYNVITQSNGNELIHALDNPPPTPYVIFLDINMPGINGLEVLQKVRESNSSNVLPIIMFSTSNDEAIIEKSRNLGASYYMPKSGIFDQLKKSIEHALSINWDIFKPTQHNFVYTY
ncbi:response regulator [Flavobacterium sp. Sd200]|uniref:response regulator n=1 Tax=Flavobacterium sp. Sd200 TaxID=2692211 RepID=UPI0013702302|nr:response regulator [Flavobacterium sp. Sd200]MXN92416.1 response regulator [Flavobacterium sp. Sd200]